MRPAVEPDLDDEAPEEGANLRPRLEAGGRDELIHQCGGWACAW